MTLKKADEIARGKLWRVRRHTPTRTAEVLNSSLSRYLVAPGLTSILLDPSSLPFRRISSYVKHRQDDNQVALHGEVHGVREAPHQRSADS